MYSGFHLIIAKSEWTLCLSYYTQLRVVIVFPPPVIVFVVVILVVAFIIMRRKRVDKDKSMFAYDNDDYDIREDVMDYDEDGAGL